MFIASLPWYDIREIQPITDKFWYFLATFLKQKNIAAPLSLCRDIGYKAQWQNKNLLFSQACGYDIVKPFTQQLQPIATPCYSVNGCLDYNYSSFLVTHRQSAIQKLEHLYQKSCVINCHHSHSGMNVLRYVIATHFDEYSKFFKSFKQSGSHQSSIEMILKKEVDVAAIDCVTYYLFEKYKPNFLENIKILYHTPHAPAPPYVTSSARSQEELNILRECLQQFIHDKKTQEVKKSLLLQDITTVPVNKYNIILTMENQAIEREREK